MERGDECGFEYGLGDATTAGPAIVDGAAELVALLTDVTYDLHTRRQPETWSPLEYGCHLRDVLSRLGPGDWERTVIYNYPTLLERSLRWVALHTLHEVRHHVFDLRRQLERRLPPTAG